MIVVQTSTSYSPSTKSSITSSSWSSSIWPWPTAKRASGTSSAQLAATMRDALHAVVDEVDLPAAVQLAQDHLAHQARRRRRVDVGLDRQALLGRRLDHAHVAHADQRHVQRARDRRGGHRQHVHLGAQLLEPLLVAHAEALLLVHDDQAEVLEAHVLLQQAVGADDDVDLARRPAPAQTALLLLRRAEAREHLDRDREGGQPLAGRCA